MKTCAMLPLPHANRRYSEAVKPLALAEMRILAPHAGVKPDSLRYETVGGLELLMFEVESSLEKAVSILRRHSAAQALFLLENGALRPLMEGDAAYLPAGMSGILKYKGKTNEQFCALLLNAAIFSGNLAARWNEPLTIIDPICGKGTALYVALEQGYNATGVEIDSADNKESRSFVKQFLTYHKLKHSRDDGSLACGPSKGAPYSTYTLATTKEAQKQGDTRTIRFVRGDTRDVGAMFRPVFDALVADLPYGVQHRGAGDPSATKLLREALPGWYAVLRPGAAMAISFNEFTLPHSHAAKLMEDAGLRVSTFAEADFSHWVEQAISRNLVIGVKPD